MTTTLTQTTEDRFNAALAAVRTARVHVALNVMTCCRSCAGYKDLGLTEDAEGQPIAWTFGGQDNELVWRDGQPYLREEEAPEPDCTCTEDEYDEDEDGNEYVAFEGEECDVCRGWWSPRPRRETPARRVYFQHEGGAAPAVRDAFTAQGFTVDWDGTQFKTVTIEF